MPTTKRPTGATVHQLKVTLKRSKPPIWRRIQVPSDVTLTKLHHILQETMGWWDCHLHQFVVGNARDPTIYGVPDPDAIGVGSGIDVGFGFGLDFGLPETKDERRVKLIQLVPDPKTKLRYEYDFGDDWDHEVLVETVLPREPGQRYPVCLAGKRACPPEDCGGVWGYADLLEALKNPDDPEHDERRQWLGREFDPEAFDLAAINSRLAEFR